MAEDQKADKSAKKAGKSKKSKKNPFKSIVSFFKSVSAECKKVVWPTAKDTIKNTAIVLLFSLVIGVAIYGVDTVLSLAMKGVKSLADNTTVSDTAEDTSESDIDIEENTNADTNADAGSEETTGQTAE